MCLKVKANVLFIYQKMSLQYDEQSRTDFLALNHHSVHYVITGFFPVGCVRKGLKVLKHLLLAFKWLYTKNMFNFMRFSAIEVIMQKMNEEEKKKRMAC